MEKTYKKVTREELQKAIAEMKEPPMDWCKPVGNGLYKTGDMYHGEGLVKELNEALKEIAGTEVKMSTEK